MNPYLCTQKMAAHATKRPVRNSLRLNDYDYSQSGVYFVTMCTHSRICYFGNIVDGIMIPFPIIDIVREIWLEIPDKFQCIDLDTFIIMPNHIHGIIVINNECSGFLHRTPLKEKNWILTKDSKQTVGRIIRYFRAKSAGVIHNGGFHRFRWQRNYFEHIVRSPGELNSIREYIIDNPMKWTLDRENCLSKNFNINLDKYFRDVFER